MKRSKLFAGSSPEKKTYSAWPSTTICFHLWKSNNQNSKWASKTTAWSRVRCTVFTSPGRLYFLLLFFLIPVVPLCLLPSKPCFLVPPYFLTLSCKTCNNWQAPHLYRKAGHEKHDIIYHNALVYKRANIVSDSLLMIACRLHYFQKYNFTWCKMMKILVSAKTYITKREKGKTPRALIYPVWFVQRQNCVVATFFWGPLPRSFFQYIFWTRMFQERQVSSKKKTTYWFPNFWPQSMSTTK